MKKILSLVLTLAMILSLTTIALAEEPEFDLQAAIDAAQNGERVTLPTDVTLTKTVKITAGKKVTLDLNGKTIDYDPEAWTYGAANSGTAPITVCFGGDLTIEDSSSEKTGTIDASYSTGFSINVYDVYSAVMMTGKGDDPSNGTAKLTVNSGTLKGFFAAVSGNKDRDDTEIIINGGKLTVDISHEYATVGIEHPMNGKLTINGGTIEGMDGISMRSGTLLITGGTIIGNAPESTFDEDGYWDNNFAACTGNAVQIVNRQNSNSAYETPSVSITGGEFSSENAEAVASYAGYKGATPDTQITGFISGGTFSGVSESINEDYLVEGAYIEDGVVIGPEEEEEDNEEEEDTSEPTPAEIERDRVVAAIKSAEDGATVTLNTKDANVVSRFIADAMSGKNVNLEYTLGEETVTVNGKSVPKTPAYRVWYSLELFSQFA